MRDAIDVILLTVVAVCVAAVIATLVWTVGHTTHETKMKRLEIVKVCVEQDRSPAECRVLGSA